MPALKSGNTQTLLPQIALATSAGVVALVTLLPVGPIAGTGMACVFCGTFATADAILNLLLFLPIGVCLRWVGQTRGRAILFGFLASASIELAQLIVIPGRDPTVSDLVANTAGTGLGYLAATVARTWLFPPLQLAAKLSLAISISITLVLAITVVLLQPSLPTTVYYGQWTPTLGHLEHYRGSVISAHVGQIAVPSHRLENTAAVREALLNDEIIRMRAIAGPDTRELGSLFSIYDERRREVLLVGPKGHDLIYRFGTKSLDMRFHQPQLHVRGAMDVNIGDTLQISVWKEKNENCIQINTTRNCGLGYTTGLGWALLIHNGYTDQIQPWINMVWLGLLLVPFGFWARRSFLTVAGAVLVVASFALLPVVAGLLATPFHEWAAAGVGFTLGVIVRQQTTRWDPRVS